MYDDFLPVATEKDLMAFPFSKYVNLFVDLSMTMNWVYSAYLLFSLAASA